jgi:hypothetical protein
MTLFTAEGLLRAQVRGALKGIVHPPSVVDHAYARWLHTQGEHSPRWAKWNTDGYDGWLVGLQELHVRRAPGRTCLSALNAERAGTLERPLNDSKGCGGVMRIAPVGLLAPRDRALSLGVEIASLTHGHASGHLAAGFLASVIAALRDGDQLDTALDGATEELEAYDGREETLAAVSAARRLAHTGAPSPEQVERLGGGWVGEEALAIGLYAVLATRSFAEAIVLGANHGGTRIRPPQSPGVSPESSTVRARSRLTGSELWSCATRSRKLPRICTEPRTEVLDGTPSLSGIAIPAGDPASASGTECWTCPPCSPPP